MHDTEIHNMIWGGLRCKYYLPRLCEPHIEVSVFGIRFAHSDHSTSHQRWVDKVSVSQHSL